MPLYAYLCDSCNEMRDELRKVDDRNKPVICDCGAKMKILIGGHNVQPDIQPYYDDNLEAPIKSRKHREQMMREKGVYEKFGKGWH